MSMMGRPFDVLWWDIATYNTSTSTSFIPPSWYINDLFFKDDWLKLYVTASNWMVYEYHLSTPWDITTKTLWNSYNPWITFSYWLFLNTDWTKFYISDWGSDVIKQYSMSVPYNLSTASYDSKFINWWAYIAWDIYFKQDWLKLYLFNYYNDNIEQYNLSVAWDISTAVYSQSISTRWAAQQWHNWLFFRYDGKKAYTYWSRNIEPNNAEPLSLQQYNLSTAWDISTMTFEKFITIWTTVSDRAWMFINQDWNRIYMTWWSASNTIKTYFL